MKNYGFVYIWFDRKHKRYYIGSHWGNINDGYICSSTWMKNSYKRRPEDFSRRILSNNILSNKETRLTEYHWLSFVKDIELGKRYYNLHNNMPVILSEEQLRSRNENISRGLKGRKLTEETKQKIALAHTGKKQSEEHKNNVSNALKGKKRTDQQKANVSAGLIGYNRTEEHRNNLAESNRNRVYKHAKPVMCITTGQTFKSIKEAAIILGLSAPGIKYALEGTRNCKGFEFLYC